MTHSPDSTSLRWGCRARALLAILALGQIVGLVVAEAQVPVALKKLFASDPADGDNFGRWLDSFDDVMCIGASGVNAIEPNAGAVYIFRRVDGMWEEEAKLFGPGVRSNESMGFPIAIDAVTRGQRIAASALGSRCGSESSCGAVYMFHYIDGSWQFVTKLQPADLLGIDLFGSSLALDGDTLVAGAERHNGDRGAAYVFTFDGIGWAQTAKLLPDDDTGVFGSSVALSGDTILVGATGDDDRGLAAGAVYVFRKSGAIWQKVDKLHASDASPSARFGFSIATSDGRALIGAGLGSGTHGSAYVFEEVSGSWTEVARLEPSRPVPTMGADDFGAFLELMGDVAVICAARDGEVAPFAGAVYVFQRTSTGVWEEVVKLLAPSSPALQGAFGRSVSLTQDSLIVGPGRDDEAGFAAGAAHVYIRGEVLAGNTNVGDGSDPADTLFVNGSAGTSKNLVTVESGVAATVSVERAPQGSGAYAFWIYDFRRYAGSPLQYRKGATTYDLGSGLKALPISNSVTPGSVPCPLTFPIGWTSQSLGSGAALTFCLNSHPGFPRAPTSFNVIFPPGNFILGGLVTDQNSINSPALNVSIANWIFVRSR